MATKYDGIYDPKTNVITFSDGKQVPCLGSLPSKPKKNKIQVLRDLTKSYTRKKRVRVKIK